MAKKNSKKNSETSKLLMQMTGTDKVFYAVLDVFLVLSLIIIAVPLWSTITLSFRPNDFIGTNIEGMFLPPWEWSSAAYKALLGNRGFTLAFANSLKILFFGVITA